MKDGPGLRLEGGRVHLLQLLVPLELGDLLAGGGDDEVDGVGVGGLGFAADEVDVDVLGDIDVPLRDGLEKGGL
jgi:hypothetical protein